MKSEIIGYVTGMINSYERTITQYKKWEKPAENYKSFDLVIEELSDLLDYVQDISEAPITDTYAEINKLTKRTEELENSCENMNEIEKNLHCQIRDLTDKNNVQKKFAEIRERANGELRIDNISWQKKCNELKLKNKYQEESLKTYEANRQAFANMATKYKELEEK